MPPTSQGEQTIRATIKQNKPFWLTVGLALTVPTVLAIGTLFVMNHRITVNAQENSASALRSALRLEQRSMRIFRAGRRCSGPTARLLTNYPIGGRGHW